MEHEIRGLHHVTATVAGAQEDLDFYIEVLGLRLVKKTVNFDNHSVYHFYYGTEAGAPGTIWTTFPYREQGVAAGRHGAGQITATSFSVPAGSLEFWTRRLRDRGVRTEEVGPRFGSEETIALHDPSGLVIELTASDRDRRAPWAEGGVAADAAIRGLFNVTMISRDPRRTMELMTGLLGFTVVGEAPNRVRVAVNGDVPGRMIEVVADPDATLAVNGLGTVHHVALAITGGEGQVRLREELIRWGCAVTEVRDRQYFRSIYFREPGGVLLEVATVEPGFAFDEELPCLGQSLKLPPWEEPNRAMVEAALPRVRHR
jgi:glyoxalase family protein